MRTQNNHLIFIFSLVLGIVALPLYAQEDVRPGDRYEHYLRLFQISGADVPVKHSFLIRPIGIECPGEEPQHWSSPCRDWGFLLESGDLVRVRLLNPSLSVSYNSTLPRGVNDGAQWQGRGLNQKLVAGFQANVGPLHLRFAPEVGFSQNADFDLGPYPARNGMPYTYPWRNFDHVQRFGEDPMTWTDLGDSYLQLRYFGLKLGVGNSRMWIGPAVYNPLLYSYNGPGFRHFVFGTYRPIKTFTGQIEFQYHLGFLEKSEYYDNRTDNRLNTASSFVYVYSPRFVPGLSLGLNRTFIEEHPGDWKGVRENAFKVFQAVFKDIPDDNSPEVVEPDNQMVSLFFRWYVPGYGFEVYGELGRNDHNVDFRDLRAQPDHDSAWLFGFMKTFNLRQEDLLAIGYEVTQLDGSRSSYTRGTGQPPSPSNLGTVGRWYAHRNRNDFTHRGQIIGAGIGSSSVSNSISVHYLKPSTQLGFRVARIAYGNGLLNFTNTYNIIRAQNPAGLERFQLRNTEIMIGLDVTRKLKYGIELTGVIEQSFIRNHLFLHKNDLNNTRIVLVVRKNLWGGIR